jgi:anti-sigma factor RsiW
MSGHERWSEEIPAYLLGALEPAEAGELERHLEGCDRCRAEVRWLEPAVRRLPERVERLEPPPRLRDRLLAEVRADAAEAAGGEASMEAETGGYRNRAESAEESERVAGWLRRLGSGSYGWRSLAGLAAVALLLVAFAGYELGSGGPGGGGETISSGEAPGVTATMVREDEGGTLRLTGVHQLPQDRVLEAWVQREGEVEAVPALFVPDHEGRASTMIEDMDGVEVVMVTAEPEGGSAQPTGEPIVTMEVE